MSNDIIFGIGGDNTDLKRSNDEAQQLIDDWINEVQNKVADIPPVTLQLDTDGLRRQFDEFDFSEPIEIPVQIDDGPLKDLIDDFKEIEDAGDSATSKLASGVGKFAAKLVAAKVIAEQIVVPIAAWATGIGKANEELDKAIARQKELDELAERQGNRARDRDIENAEDLGPGKELERLNLLIKNAEAQLRNAKRRKETADAEVEDSKSFFTGGGSDGAFFGVELARGAREESEQATKDIARQEAAIRKLENAREAARVRAKRSAEKAAKAEQDAIEKAAKAEEKKQQQTRDTNEKIKERLELLRLQAQLESDSAEVRENAQRQIDQNAANKAFPNNPFKADEIVEAQARKRAAAAESDQRRQDRREQERSQNQAKREQEQFQRDSERFEERMAAQRERIAQSDDDRAERRLRLERRQSQQRRDLNRPIGGVDSSLQAAISRIQQSASKPDPRAELAERHRQELVAQAKEAKVARDKQVAALEKMAAREPVNPGLL